MNIVIHTDELSLKGRNQPLFYRQLIKNIQSLLRGVSVKRHEGGLWLENVRENDLDQLALIPGVANFAPAVRVQPDKDEIKKAIDHFLHKPEVHAFRISAERSFKQSPFTSKELEHEMGDYVRIKTGWNVHLKQPDLELNILVGKKHAYVFETLREGTGGLPTGSSGKVLCLLSGGIDSPVAAYTMMRRGAQTGLIHFQNETRVAEEVGQKIFDLAQVLARYQPDVELFIVPFADLQREVVKNISSTYRMIMIRRLFFMIAEHVAAQHGYGAVATGDSLGQVASQTLENMNAIYQATGMLKLSPLISMNKRDIMAMARRIGTLDISNRPYEDCCSLFVAKRPVTKARLNEVLKLEKALDRTTLDKVSHKLYHFSKN